MSIENFILTHGKPENKLDFDFRKYPILANCPDFLKEIWDAYGLSSFRQNFFWFINPEDSLNYYKSMISNEVKNPIPFFRTAFGDLLYWDEEESIVLQRIPVQSESFLGENFSFIFNNILCREKVLNEGYWLEMYVQALPKLGVVERDECLGFFPPVAMGGEIRVDKLQRVKLREHLAFLSQL